MKRFLLTLLAVVLIAGVLVGAGFAGYRYGYQQGVLATSNGDMPLAPFARGDDFNWRRMPMHEFGEGLNRPFRPGLGFGRGIEIRRGWGFVFFPSIGFLVQLAVLGFIVWLVYKLLTGWRLSLTRATPESPRVETETKPTEEQRN